MYWSSAQTKKIAIEPRGNQGVAIYFIKDLDKIIIDHLI
jgi:hypothetical protein